MRMSCAIHHILGRFIEFSLYDMFKRTKEPFLEILERHSVNSRDDAGPHRDIQAIQGAYRQINLPCFQRPNVFIFILDDFSKWRTVGRFMQCHEELPSSFYLERT